VPSEILEDMRKGVEVIDRKKVLVIENREEAIRTACTLAESNDVVLVAGKGHEKYQEVNGVRHGFDDKEKLRTAFKEFEL
ncbi:MAG: glutamate ligase domain-containing protein, partial [Chitinophagales bacterium]